MKNKYISLVLVLALAPVSVVRAHISAINMSGQKLRLSLHGDGCRQPSSDSDNGYIYPACAEKEIDANQTVVFSDIFPPERELSYAEKIVWPEVHFGSYRFSFSYKCALLEFVGLRVCKNPDFLFDEKTRTEPLPSDRDVTDKKNGVLIPLDGNYMLSILPGWGWWPRHVDCKVTRIVEDAALCQK
jgi:hypothetical protein